MNKKMNANFAKMIALLNDGQYHDGTTIGGELGMTRSAVWKAIKKLEAYDVPIHSVKGKGYALLEPLILLDSNKIKKLMNANKMQLEIFETIDSTNHYLKKLDFSNTIRICLSEQQTQGKGRFNREWHSPFGQNIYFSCRYPFQKDVSELAGLSLVIGLVILKTLKIIGVDNHLSLKWPNDIIYQNKKLSGVLIEVLAETHGVSEAIIGIGINVNMKSHDKNISQEWTSLSKVIGGNVDRNMLVATLINELLTHLDIFKQNGFAAFATEWINADILTNQLITIKNADQKVEGIVAGVNDQGHLMLRLKNGNVCTYSAGDTTVMKKAK